MGAKAGRNTEPHGKTAGQREKLGGTPSSGPDLWRYSVHILPKGLSPFPVPCPTTGTLMAKEPPKVDRLNQGGLLRLQ